MPKEPAVYILSSKRNGTLYVGVTGDLQTRTWIHKHESVEGFTKQYGVHLLVYYELHPDMIFGDNQRETDQEMEPRMEARANRRAQSRMEGLVGRNHLKTDGHRFPLSRE